MARLDPYSIFESVDRREYDGTRGAGIVQVVGRCRFRHCHNQGFGGGTGGGGIGGPPGRYDFLRAPRETPNTGGGGRAPQSVDPGLSSRGFRPPSGTRVKPQGIPNDWRIKPTKGEGGARYVDPKNPGNSVRVMPGNPNSPHSNSQAPYVRWQRNGQALDANGNVVPKNTPGAHIPLQDFQFNPGVFE